MSEERMGLEPVPDPDRLAAIKERRGALVQPAWTLSPEDVDWLIAECERLRAALAQADNTISAVRRGAQQARNEIHVALGWDHGGIALVEDPSE